MYCQPEIAIRVDCVALKGKAALCIAPYLHIRINDYVACIVGPHAVTAQKAVLHSQMRKTEMSIDRAVLRFAGVMIFLSVALTLWVSPYFVWFTVFIGANLLQSSFTGFCPAASVFKAIGVKKGCAFE